jgi:hypothetical protein
VLSTQHRAEIDLETLLRPDIEEHVIRPLLPDDIDTSDVRIYVNPTGRFELGGPVADAGLTGRKIIVDTYGGMARHGGGAFSGKDPSKVDRSAAYATRWVAKNIVAAGLAAQGRAAGRLRDRRREPGVAALETFGTEQADPDAILAAVREVFDLRPAAIIDALDLRARLPRDRRVRPLRPRGRPLHLGAHRPRRRAARRRRRLSRRAPACGLPAGSRATRVRRAEARAGRPGRRRGRAVPPRPALRLPRPRRPRGRSRASGSRWCSRGGGAAGWWSR